MNRKTFTDMTNVGRKWKLDLLSSQTVKFCAVALLLVCQAPVALAVPIPPTGTTLDQYSFLEPGNSGIAYLTSPGEEFRRAQSFTVGLSGQLDSILVEFNSAVFGWGDGVADEMRLFSVSNGIPGEILATSNVRTLTPYNTDTNNFAFGTFDFSNYGLIFNVGDVLAFEVVHDGAVQWYENTYAGGSDILINPPYYTDWTQLLQIDTGFQTYVRTGQTNPDPPAHTVPEPSTIWLLLTALAALAVVTRQRRRGVLK